MAPSQDIAADLVTPKPTPQGALLRYLMADPSRLT